MKLSTQMISKRLVLHYLLAGILLYFIFHLIYGNRSIMAYFSLNKQIEAKSQELDLTKAERLELEHKVKSLKTESLDRDMLDEEARRSLGLANEKEQVFIPDDQLK